MDESLEHEEQDLVVRYVMGELSESEQIELEQRMVEDDELSRAVAGAMDVDRILMAAKNQEPRQERAAGDPHRRVSPGPERDVRPSWQNRIAALAAAAALLTLAGIWISSRGGQDDSNGELRVALSASSVSYLEYAASAGFDEDSAPVNDYDRRRGDPLPEGVGEEAVDRLIELEREAIAAALRERPQDVTGEAFVVPISTRRAVTALVLALFPDGSVRRYFPAPGEPVAAARLAAGEHVLPARRLETTDEWRPIGLVAFSSGFVLPLSQPSAHVAVVVVDDDPGAERMTEIAALEATAWSDVAAFEAELAAILPAAAVSVFRISEP